MWTHEYFWGSKKICTFKNYILCFFSSKDYIVCWASEKIVLFFFVLSSFTYPSLLANIDSILNKVKNKSSISKKTKKFYPLHKCTLLNSPIHIMGVVIYKIYGCDNIFAIYISLIPT